MLDIFRRTNFNRPIVVQIRNAHWEGQREGLGETPFSSRLRWLVVNRGPTISHGLGIRFGVGLLLRGVPFALRNGATGTVAEHVRSPNALFQQALCKIVELVRLRVDAWDRQGPSSNEARSERANSQSIRSGMPQFLEKTRRRILRIGLP